MDTFYLDGLSIVVEDDGEGIQPWTRGGSCYRYRVTLRDDHGNVYDSPAFGSQNDHEAGRRDPRGIGGMVAQELLSAALDPDGFYDMATEAEAGSDYRSRYEAARRVLAIDLGTLGAIRERGSRYRRRSRSPGDVALPGERAGRAEGGRCVVHGGGGRTVSREAEGMEAEGLTTDLIVRDVNGNTLDTIELPHLPYDGFRLVEAHVSDAGSLVVTVDTEEEER